MGKRGTKKGRPNGPQAEQPNVKFRGRAAKVNNDGTLRIVGFFKKGSKCSLIIVIYVIEYACEKKINK